MCVHRSWLRKHSTFPARKKETILNYFSQFFTLKTEGSFARCELAIFQCCAHIDAIELVVTTWRRSYLNGML